MIRDLRRMLDEGGLRGSFLVRDLRTGEELGIDPDDEYATASLVKIPLAAATLDRVRRGELDGAMRLTVGPGARHSPGPTGTSRFRHPAEIAVDDLLLLTMTVSDNTAGDALFELTPPAMVAAFLEEHGLRGISVRHTLRHLTESPVQALGGHLAHVLAIEGSTAGRGHPVPELDVTRGSSGSARAFVDLLAALWRPSRIDPWVAGRVRELMGDNVLRQRLAPDFTSDLTTWSSKTGTMLNLRHEVGVVEHVDGQVHAVAALTESRVAAVRQPGAEALMAQVARALRDEIRSR